MFPRNCLSPHFSPEFFLAGPNCISTIPAINQTSSPVKGLAGKGAADPLPPTLAEGTEVDNLPAVAVFREVYLSPLFLGA